MAPSVTERINVLRQEFAQIDVNHDENITVDELLNYLDQKCGTEYDRNVAYQLFDRMDKNYDGKVDADEYIKVFLEAEEILQTKIDNSKKFIEDYYRQRKEATQKLEESRTQEKMNGNGIMEGSNLNITVIECQGLNIDLKTSGNSNDVFVTIQKQSEIQQTQTAKGVNPQFNSPFAFNVNTGAEIFTIKVQTQQQFNNNEFIGQAQINLQNLRDQNFHDDWFDLTDRNGQFIKGRIHLKLQWIYSRVKYLSDLINQKDENIKNQEEDLADFERDLVTIYEPFKMYQRLIGGQKTLTSTNQVSGFQPKQDFVFDHTSKQASPVGPNLVDHKYFDRDAQYNLRLCILAGFVFALFSSFYRPCFINFGFYLSFIYNWNYNLLDAKSLQYHTAFLLVLAVNDIIWLSIYSGGWWYSDEQATGLDIQISATRFAVFCSWLMLFLEIASFGLAGKLIYETRKLANEQQQQQATGQQNESFYNQRY